MLNGVLSLNWGYTVCRIASIRSFSRGIYSASRPGEKGIGVSGAPMRRIGASTRPRHPYGKHALIFLQPCIKKGTKTRRNPEIPEKIYPEGCFPATDLNQ